MIVKGYTIHKIYALQKGETGQGETWYSRDIVLKDETHEFGDSILCRLRGDKAVNFGLFRGDVVEASIDFRTREYTTPEGVERPVMDAKCWKIERAQGLPYSAGL